MSKDLWLIQRDKQRGTRVRKKQRDEMLWTFTPVRVPGNAEIRNQILEGGRVLARLIGKEFPVAGQVWPEINIFHRMIDDRGLNDTWVTMVGPEDREVRNVAMACFLVFLLLLTLYLIDCSAGNHRLSCQVLHMQWIGPR